MNDGGCGSLPADAGIGRVDLVVNDIDRVRGFYLDTIGLEVIDETTDRLNLGTGMTTLISLTERPDLAPRPMRAAGLFHLAIRVPMPHDLAGVARRLDAENSLTGASDHGVSEALYTRDPAGNGVEVYRDRPRADWPGAGDAVAMQTAPLDVASLIEAESTTGGEVLPPETDIGHVHLEVTDLERSAAYYTETLGFRERDRRRGAKFLAAGDYHHHVGINVWNSRTEPVQGLGSVVVTVAVPDRTSVDTVAGVLEAAGHEIDRTDDACLVADPDGIGIRIARR